MEKTQAGLLTISRENMPPDYKGEMGANNILKPVYFMGEIPQRQNFYDIRQRALSTVYLPKLAV